MTMEQAQSGQWLESVWKDAESRWAYLESQPGGLAQFARRSELFRFSSFQDLCVSETDTVFVADKSTGADEKAPRPKVPKGVFVADFESLKKDPHLSRVLKFQALAEQLGTLKDDLPTLSILKAHPKTFFIDVHSAQQSVLSLSELLVDRQCVEHVLICVAENQSVTILDDLSGRGKKSQLLQVHLGQGSKLNLFTLVQARSGHLQAFSLRQKFYVEAGAELQFRPLLLGRSSHVEQAADSMDAPLQTTLGQDQFGQLRSEVVLKGKGSVLDVKAVLEGEFKEKTDFILNVHHDSPQSLSNTNVWSVMANEARGCFHGTIFIAESSSGVEAHQRTKSLTLSSRAEVVMLPKLEISCDDVKCSHGASVASVSEDQLHYLQSRGLEAWQARSMIIDGFTRPVLEMLPVGDIKHGLFLELYGEAYAKGGEDLW